jgi:predicted phosphodiesterase
MPGKGDTICGDVGGMEVKRSVLIGILADSHGSVEKLAKGIEALKRRDARTIIHLGDAADTLKPETVNECIGLLIQSEIACVMGNHEYSLVMHHFKRYPDRFSDATKKYVCSMPQWLEVSGICFTHFSPNGGVYGLFAATDEASYEQVLRGSAWPVLINGHSHDPRIYSQWDGKIEHVQFDTDRPFVLEKGVRYVLTCGAIEDCYCALYDVKERRFEVILLNR